MSRQDGVRLDDDDTMLLFRHLVKIGCEPGAVGHMSSGASPMDPIFWVLHPIFEKALHVLWMSPKFRDKYTFEWEDGSCNGSKLYDRLPFTGECEIIPVQCKKCSVENVGICGTNTADVKTCIWPHDARSTSLTSCLSAFLIRLPILLPGFHTSWNARFDRPL